METFEYFMGEKVGSILNFVGEIFVIILGFLVSFMGDFNIIL
jgi:hypothetical protein